MQPLKTFPDGKAESGFQSYHIVIFKMLFLTKIKAYKMGKYALFTGKKKRLTEAVPEKGQLEAGTQSLNVGILEFSITFKRKWGCFLLESHGNAMLSFGFILHYEYYQYFALLF